MVIKYIHKLKNIVSKKSFQGEVDQVLRLEKKYKDYSDDELKSLSLEFKKSIQDKSQTMEDILLDSFALVREASVRTLGLRHFDVQVLGSLSLHKGMIAEMKTGEGKTLAATMAVYLNALEGNGVHVVTVNDYLAKRDANSLRPLYEFLGLSVGIILENMGQDEDSDTKNRQKAYRADITYGTNHEMAFDYLRDNLEKQKSKVVQRGLNFAIVDEVDFLLIDEAKTPLIISGASKKDVSLFKKVDRITKNLKKETHYTVEEKSKVANLNDEGFEEVQKKLKIENLSSPENISLYHAVYNSVLAHGAYRRDVDYIVDKGEVFIVDEFTGRVSEDKRFSDGLHQALEAKESLKVQAEDRTDAKITYQSYFGLYKKLSGMTGTAIQEKEEFKRVYSLDVKVIPTNKPNIRKDYETLIYNTMAEKHEVVVAEIKDLTKDGRPVLVGTASVHESEVLSRQLKRVKVPHKVLNAKNNTLEASIISQAGRFGAVTISTSMAGRGTDIMLGGNFDSSKSLSSKNKEAQEEERNKIVAAGGLHVIGASYYEAKRIDDQLRGRSGRQGDPGSTQFIVSLEDDIWQKYGKNDIKGMREKIREQDVAKGTPLEWKEIKTWLAAQQHKIETESQFTRKEIIKYDSIVHSQRETIYKWRRKIILENDFNPNELIDWSVGLLLDEYLEENSLEIAFNSLFNEEFKNSNKNSSGISEQEILDQINKIYESKLAKFGVDEFNQVGSEILLESIDELWTDHLANLEHAEDVVSLLDYAEKDPFVEWTNAANQMWKELITGIRKRTVMLWFKVTIT